MAQKKSNFMKNLLATASLVAVSTVGAQNAMAGTDYVTDVGANVDLNANDFKVAPAPAGPVGAAAALVSGAANNIHLVHARNITNISANTLIGDLVVYNGNRNFVANGAFTFTVTNVRAGTQPQYDALGARFTGGPFNGFANGADPFAAGANIGFTGVDAAYTFNGAISGIGNSTIAANGSLVFANNATQAEATHADNTMNGTIDSAGGANNGAIVVNRNMTFAGVIGAGGVIKSIAIGADKIVNFNAAVTVGNGGAVAIAAGAKVTANALFTTGTSAMTIAGAAGASEATFFDAKAGLTSGSAINVTNATLKVVGGNLVASNVADATRVIKINDGGVLDVTGLIMQKGAVVVSGAAANVTLRPTAGNDAVDADGFLAIDGKGSTTVVKGNMAGFLTTGANLGEGTVTVEGNINAANGNKAYNYASSNTGLLNPINAVANTSVILESGKVEVTGTIANNVNLKGTAVLTHNNNILANGLTVAGDARYIGLKDKTVNGAVNINTNTTDDAKKQVVGIAGNNATVTKGNLDVLSYVTGNLTVGDNTAGNVGNVNVLGFDIVNDKSVAGNLTVAQGTVDIKKNVGGNLVIADGGVNGVAKVNIGGNVGGNLTMDVANAAKAEVTVEGNVAATSITYGSLTVKGSTGAIDSAAAPAPAVNGSIRLVGTNDTNGQVGNGGLAVTKVIIDSGKRTFAAGNFKVAELQFTGSDSAVLFKGASMIDNIAKVTIDGNGKHQIDVTEDSTIADANVYGDEKKVSQLTLNVFGKTLNIGGAKVYANITANTENQGKVVFNAVDGSVVGRLGASDKKLETVTFTNSAEVRGGAYSGTMAVADAMTATFKNGGSVVVDKGIILGVANAAAHAIFDGTTLASNITSNAADVSDVVLRNVTQELTTTIGTGAAKMKAVTFEKSDITLKPSSSAAAAIFATDLAIKNSSTVHVASEVKHDAKVTVDSSSIIFGAVGQNYRVTDLTLKGNVALKDKVTYDNGSYKTSAIVVSSAANGVNATDLTNLTIELDDNATLFNSGAASIKVIESSGNKAAQNLTTDKITVKGSTARVEWSANVDANGNVVLSRNADLVTSLKNDVNSAEDKAFIAELAKAVTANPGSDAAALANVAARLDKTNLQEFVDRLKTASTEVAAAVGAVTRDVTDVMGNRLSTMSAPVMVASEGASGVAAGSDDARNGAWVNPFYGSSTQKLRSDVAGYKANSFGGTVGFDTKITDSTILGAALTAVRTDVKHQDYKSGDKTKVDSVLVSLYGMQDINDNFFAQGVATLGFNKVKAKEARRISNTAKETAAADYDANNITAEILGGYRHMTNNVSIVPTAGFRFTRNDSVSYTEKGTTNSNMNVSVDSSNKLDLVIGGRIIPNVYAVSGLSISPEVHFFMNQKLTGQDLSVESKLNGLANPMVKNPKPAKTSYNLGLSVGVEQGMMEYSVGYDAHFADKYLGHQGSLKVRVNF